MLITISIFAIFVFFNIYIRVKTFGLYRQLVQRRIQFKFKDVFSRNSWDKVMSNYPEDIVLLQKFRSHMLSTGIMFIVVIIVVLILLFTLSKS